MGAERFITYSKGATAKEAFELAVESAEYEYGHSGYTGTIAEKDDFVMVDVSLPEGWGAEELFDALDEYVGMGGLDPIAVKLLGEEKVKAFAYLHDDKWGPAVGIHMGGEMYVFGGWASC